MASKTAVNTFITKMKRRFDYNITDTPLDLLLIDAMNDSLKLLKQWLFDAGLYYDVSNSSSFQTIPGQEYRDIEKAVIIGDTATFTGIAGDTIDVHIDGSDYTDIDISAATDIDDVVTAINTAVGSTVASNNATSGTLQIQSLTTGSTSICTIADGTSTTQTVVGDLFSVSADRTNSAITDLDDIIRLSDRDNDNIIQMIPWSKFKLLYTDPTNDSTTSPDHACRFDDRIYFGPRPSSYIRIYIDYIQLLDELVAGDTLPFNAKYDNLLLATTRVEFLMWQDPSNTQALTAAMGLRDKYKQEMIISAAKNTAVDMQSASRNETGFIRPQAPDSGDFSAG